MNRQAVEADEDVEICDLTEEFLQGSADQRLISKHIREHRAEPLTFVGSPKSNDFHIKVG
jgi:hypothetical protein